VPKVLAHVSKSKVVSSPINLVPKEIVPGQSLVLHGAAIDTNAGIFLPRFIFYS
jgi:hypothetical protein